MAVTGATAAATASGGGGGGTTNVRTLAQDIVSWYESQVDEYSPHGDNVRIFLRRPIVAVTVGILLNNNNNNNGKTTEEEIVAGAAAAAAGTTTKMNGAGKTTTSTTENGGGKKLESSSSSSWRDYLPTSSKQSNEVDFGGMKTDPEVYKKLGYRTKARLEAFLENVILAVPTEDVVAPDAVVAAAAEQDDISTKTPEDAKLLKEGLSGFGSSSQRGSNGSTGGDILLRSMSTTSNKLSNNSATTVKLPQIMTDELLIRVELYLRSLYRVKSLSQDCVIIAEPVRAMKARARSITIAFVDTVSTVRQQGYILHHLLVTMTKELLAVDILSAQLLQIIRRLVSKYEHTTSFASLAFLSSPENAASESLTPLIIKYLRYLQANWKTIECDCNMERFLVQSLDPKMRYTFKTVEFHSIGHLLHVCEAYAEQLQNIQLTPSVAVTTNYEAALNDKEALSQAIRDLQREVITVNGRVLPPVTTRQALVDLLTQTLNSNSLTLAKRTRRKTQRTKGRNGSASATDPEDSLTEGDTTGAESDNISSGNRSGSILRGRGVGRRRSFRLSAIDLLTRRLLLAGGRTGTGGDAFFVVRDLFGDDDDVEVVPSQTLLTHGRGIRSGTIEIIVKMASITIRCHGSFDVYPKSMVGDVEPLIQIHTTTSETISLQEVRATDVKTIEAGLKKNHYDSDDDDDDNGQQPPMILQERKTEKTGLRLLSVRPALYEKVEVWNTPS